MNRSTPRPTATVPGDTDRGDQVDEQQRRRRRTSQGRRLIAVAAAGALVLGACGSRVDSDDDAAAGLGGGGATPSTTAAPSGGEEGMIGTLPIPCRDGDTSSYPEQSDVGVTRDKIVIGTISDPGGPRPGLNQGLFDTMLAFADWCNSLGGINGREVEIQVLDAKLLEYKERVLEGCDSSFALVGGLGVFDDLGAQDQVDCGIPNIPAAVVSVQAAGADLTWQPMPNPPGSFLVGSGQWIAEQYPDAITKAGSVQGNVQTIITQADRLKAAYSQIGYEFISTQTVNIAETNWAPFVLNLENDGVEYLNSTSTYEEVLPMLKVMNEQGWSPEVMEYETNFYDQRFIDGAAEQGIDMGNAYLKLTTWPFEEADERPAMDEYLRILDASTSDYDTDPQQLGVQGFSAALLWATAADQAGADLTRETLATELDKITDWTGGGLHGATTPGENSPSNCFVIMKVSTEGFERVYPLPEEDAEVYEAGDGQACPEDGRVDIPEFDGQGATAGG